MASLESQSLTTRSMENHTTPKALSNRLHRSLKIQKVREVLVFLALLSATLFTILVTCTIVGLIATETTRFFGQGDVTLSDFAFGLKWEPTISDTDKKFGVIPLVVGTLWVTAIAMVVALPLGLITAIFLSEYAPAKLRTFLKPMLEILAGIPTVVYGFFALTFITPMLRTIGWNVDFFNATSAGIAVGILCLPIVSSLAEDALRAVPNRLREAAYGLGGTKFDVATKVVVPAALSGIISAFLLAISRAIGETMIVTLAAGQLAKLTLDPGVQIQTMTGYMTQAAKGDISNFGPEYYSLYAVAATLFVLTYSLTVIGNIVRKKFREVYE